MTRTEPSTRKHFSRLRPAMWLVPAAVIAVAAVVALTGGVAQAQSQAAPDNSTEPSVSGTPEIGKTLTGNHGVWSGGTITYVYAWLRCDANGNSCATVANATSTTYSLAGADAGARMRFRVTASNADGPATATSNPTGVVGATGPPVSTKDPSVSGTAAVDQQLTADAGTWSGEQPITFTFRWLRCDSGGNNCVEISGATDDQYTVKSSDLDRTLRVRLSARNSSDEKTKLTSPTAKVVAGGIAGAIKLPSGQTSIPVTSVGQTERLIVDSVTFTPSPVRSRTTPIDVVVRVKDTRGNVVRDALVFLRSTPIVTSTPPAGKTGQDGTIRYTIQPTADFPLRNNHNVQFFVKAYRAGDNPLAGVSGTRLVQVKTAR